MRRLFQNFGSTSIHPAIHPSILCQHNSKLPMFVSLQSKTMANDSSSQSCCSLSNLDPGCCPNLTPQFCTFDVGPSEGMFANFYIKEIPSLKKFRIRDTPTLLTDTNSRTDIILERLCDLLIRTKKRTWSTQKCGLGPR